MKITYKLEALERKTLVKAIALQTGLKAKYLAMPSAAYQIGDLHVAKDATLTGPDDRDLVAALRDQHSFVPESEEYDAQAEAPAEENVTAELPKPALYARFATDEQAEEAGPEFPTEPELDRVVIEMPLEGFTPAALDNLCKMVSAKEELIKLAIGAESLPIQVLEDRIAFPWLQTADPDMVDALATFICALCKTAREKKRVTATPQPTGINDRYRFRCFMLHIGMIGPEYAAARTKLMAPLSGNSGWLAGPPEKAPAPEEAPAAEEQAPQADPAEEPAAIEEAPAPQEEAPAAAPAEETKEAEAHDND